MLKKIFSGIIGAATGAMFIVSIMICFDGRWLQGIIGLVIALYVTVFDFIMFDKAPQVLFSVFSIFILLVILAFSIAACIAGFWGQGILGIIFSVACILFVLAMSDVIRIH